MENWYLLRCKSRQEKRAESHLLNQGYHCYGPIVSVNKSKTVIPKLVSEPLFPGYLFVRLDENACNWPALKSTRGVLDFVRFGGYPTMVPDHIVSTLIEEVPSIEIGLSSSMQLSAGDSVMVKSGCFEGLGAIYQCESGRDRGIVLISIIGKNTEVTLNKVALEKA